MQGLALNTAHVQICSLPLVACTCMQGRYTPARAPQRCGDARGANCCFSMMIFSLFLLFYQKIEMKGRQLDMPPLCLLARQSWCSTLALSLLGCSRTDLDSKGCTSPDACEQGTDHAQEAALHCWIAWSAVHQNEHCQPRLGAWPKSPALEEPAKLVVAHSFHLRVAGTNVVACLCTTTHTYNPHESQSHFVPSNQEQVS